MSVHARRLETERTLHKTFCEQAAIPLARTRLYDCPAPLSDESFSSWVIRVSVHYTLSPANFLQLCLGSKPMRQLHIDMDILVPDYLPRQLSSMTGYESKIFDPMLSLNLGHLSFPSIDWLNRNLDYGRGRSSYCTACLQADRIPYFRNAWRYKIPCCPIHDIEMNHGCQNCGLPVAPARHAPKIDSGPGLLGECPYCGSDLAKPSKKGNIAPASALLPLRSKQKEERRRVDATQKNDTKTQICSCKIIEPIPVLDVVSRDSDRHEDKNYFITNRIRERYRVLCKRPDLFWLAIKKSR
jgi:hypothetical protein